MQSPHDAETSREGQAAKQGPRTSGEELPKHIDHKLEHLNLNQECLRKKRLLGGAGTQDFEMFSLPVSRVQQPSQELY